MVPNQIHYTKNDWLSTIFFSSGETYTKIVCPASSRFVSFNVILFNDRVLFGYAPSGHGTRKQLTKSVSLKDYKNKRNENKIKLGYFNCTIDKTNRDSKSKTQILYRSWFNYALSKLILYNMLDDLWRRQNRDSSAFTHYEISFGTRYRTAMVYADIKTASNAKINHNMISFTTDHYSAISIYKN